MFASTLNWNQATSAEDNMELIEEIKERFKDEWVLLEVLERDEMNRPTKGRIIAHSRNRDDTYNAMATVEAKHLYHYLYG